jgi:hypothetical protein
VRFKLLRRRLSISAPRMIVRSHLPWPVRWLVIALMFGFSAAVAMWAFEFGKVIAGVDTGLKEEVVRLREEVAVLRAERDKAVSVASTAESLLRAEGAAQQRLAQQLKQAEAEILSLRGDLGFFERLMPVGSGDDLAISGLQAETVSPGRMRLQLLVMQPGRQVPEFQGRYTVSLSGTLEGAPWTFRPASDRQTLKMKQYVRVDEFLEIPPAAVVKLVEVRILDAKGAVRATQSLRL